MKLKMEDALAVQLQVLTRLIVHLDERSLVDARAFGIELLLIARELPAGQANAVEAFCSQLETQTATSRARRPPPTSERH